ncbi:endonuclease/exonuclease/phosphatase family protein [Actinotalea solisilvae]|uniref:endonuclease/exonuclease/phosphatase family protein n=1 Tax=Actinotalea solisilvae TaxID=2072922 RepID=UPI0018F1C151|nr:endonuclease/exonuclease/phosphatase family protein [Actinotalea solisilvae]
MSDARRAAPARRRAAVGAACALAAAAVVALVAPDRLGLHGTLPFAQLVALRGLVGGALATGAVVLVALPWRRALAPVAGVLAIGAVAQLAVLADRGLDGTGAVLGDRPDDAVAVLVLNTQDHLGAEAIAAVLVEHRPDVVVLPETLGATARGAAELAAAHGLDLQVLADDRGGAAATGATALLTDRRLGTYRVVEDHPGALASFTATSDGLGPPVSAVHPYPPLPAGMAGWRDETAAAVALCAEHPGGVVAGDLNATLDHPAFDGAHACVDAALEAGVAGVGTWPVGVPRVLGAAIDHVLVDGDAWRVLGVSVLEPPAGTDHRGLLAVLVPAG